jgi:hypothetical protein
MPENPGRAELSIPEAKDFLGVFGASVANKEG